MIRHWRLASIAQVTALSFVVISAVGLVAPTSVIRSRGELLRGLIGRYNPSTVKVVSGTNVYFHPNPPFAGQWGHTTQYHLQVLDTQGNPDGDGYPWEAFGALNETKDPVLVAALNKIATPPGTASGWPMGSGSNPNAFVDTNSWNISYNSGDTTFWFSFPQTFSVSLTGLPGDPFKLSPTFTVTHQQNIANRN